MRIAFFTDTLYPQINGVSNTLNYLSRYLHENDIEHVFFAPDYGSEACEDERLQAIRFKSVAPIIYPECRLSFPTSAKIIKELEIFQPDVVHIVTELGIGHSGLRAARALDLPVVMSYHTNFNKYLDYYHLRYLSKSIWTYLKWFHSFAEVNLCPSENTLIELESLGFENLDIWSRGIDSEMFNPNFRSESIRKELGGQNKTIFLYVGRISAEKGLDTLAESIRSFNEKYEDEANFVFTGDGPYLDELASMGIPNVVLTGAKRGKELSEIYASSDVFVFPSGTETFGNVMLEAMASGLPGICVNAGGVTDYAVHNENAFVCNYRDAGSLADAMEKMLDSQLREKISAGALKLAKQRSWNFIFDNLITHYKAAAQTQFSSSRKAAG